MQKILTFIVGCVVFYVGWLICDFIYELYRKHIKKKYRVSFEIPLERYQALQKNASKHSMKTEHYIKTSVSSYLRELAYPERE